MPRPPRGPNGDWPVIDLDDVRARARDRFGGVGPGRTLAVAVVVLLALIMLLSTWYTVQPEETAVVQRFGAATRTAGPGLHFKLPWGIEKVTLVPTARVLKEEFGFRTEQPAERTRYVQAEFEQESLMLTGDLNVIDVEWIVQYRIEDPQAFLFNVREPRTTIRDVAEAIMRRVVGNRLGSDVLTVARVAVSTEVKEEMQKILEQYQTGVRLVTVELQDVTPPDPVKPAFNEVNEARQDKERMINQAQEAANREIPKARGEAVQITTEAEGYAIERVNRARGDSDRFNAVLEAYAQAKDVTRRRLYLETLTTILPEVKALYVVDEAQKAVVPWLGLETPATSAPAAAAKP